LAVPFKPKLQNYQRKAQTPSAPRKSDQIKAQEYYRNPKDLYFNEETAYRNATRLRPQASAGSLKKPLINYNPNGLRNKLPNLS